MKRKPQTWFIYLLCLGLAIVCGIASLTPLSTSASQVIAKSQNTPVSTEIRGVWLTNVGSAVLFTPWGVNRALQQLSQLNFNTVYPVVWNRGHTFYPSSVARLVTGYMQDPLLDILRLGQDVLAEIIKQGHRHRLRIIPWFEYGFMAPVGSELVRRHPDWIASSRDNTKILKEAPNELESLNAKLKQPQKIGLGRQVTSKQVWLNPLHPDVQQFILDLIVEVVTYNDVGGIQLDDHFGLPVELGYDPFTVQLYQKEHQGKSPPNDPLDSEWMRWRADKITTFMQRIFKSVKATKPNAIVSLSPNSQSFSYRSYLQDWQTWVQRGLVEELVLQVYRDDMNSFLHELKQPAVEMARRQIPVGVGILSGLWSRPVDIAQIQKQVKVVRDRGFAGVSFFYWESLWGYIAPESPRERRAAFRSLFPPFATRSSSLEQPRPQIIYEN